MMKKLVLFVVILLAAVQMKAQDLAKLIPADAIAVMAINAESYSKKVDMDKVMDLDMMKAFDQQVKRQMGDNYDIISLIYKDPKAVGIDMTPKAYGYVQSLDSLFFGAFIANISDKKKFEDLLNALPMIQMDQIQKGAGYNYITLQTAALVWTNSVVMISMVEGEQKGLYKDLDYDDENYYDKLDARRKAFKETKKSLLTQKLGMISSVSSSITSNANYSNFSTATFDVGLWVSMEPLMAIIQKAQESSPMLAAQAQMMESMNTLLDDTYYHTLLTFDAGEVNLVQKSFMNQRMFDLYKNVYDKKIQPKMLNYVNASNLLGFGVVAVDIKQLVAASIDLYSPMLDNMPGVGGGKADAILDLLAIALDEDALANIIDGELLVAVTDFKEVEMTYIDYEYDDDYNLKKVEKTRKQQMPLVVGEIGIGNKDNFMKLIQALESYQLVSKQDNIYSLTIPTSKIDIKIALLDDIALITNDMNLIENDLKGVKKKEQLPADLQADVLKYNQYIYIDMQHIIQAAMNANKYMSTSEKEMMTMLQEKFDDMRLMGIEMGDKSFSYYFKASMTDKKTNSAMQLFNIANEVYQKDQAKSEAPIEEKKD